MTGANPLQAHDEAGLESLLRNEYAQHMSVAAAMEGTILADLAGVLQLLEQSVRAGGKLLIFGNGGSAADAQHFAAELVVRYKSDRRAIPAIALTTDSSTLTACGNDLGFEALFERQVEAHGRPGDVAVGISTSGRSPNVLRGFRQARAGGLRTVGMSGGTGGDMAALCDAMINVPSTVTARIQEMHITIIHMLCAGLELRLGLA